MQVIERARSARVDLFGGTLDIPPIHLILDGVVTLNAAIGLKSRIHIGPSDFAGVEIHSLDYGTVRRIPWSDWTEEKIYRQKAFQEFNFVVQLLNEFPVLTWSRSQMQGQQGLNLQFSSDIPPGSGLGGSSVMGINLYEALCAFFQRSVTQEEILKKVQGIEARILDAGPTGYQDYYPALYGGVLALLPHADRIEVHQLFTPELKEFLESRLTLVYSGQARFSGINNWEVYKAFFDRKESVRRGLQELSHLAQQAYQVLLRREYEVLPSLLIREGQLRQQLFSQIATLQMLDLVKTLQKKFPTLGLKVCGAGGGGCFLLIHEKGEGAKLAQELPAFAMKKLDFQIESPCLSP